MTFQISVKLRVKWMTNRGSWPSPVPPGHTDPKLPTTKISYALPEQPRTHHQAGSTAPLLSPCKYHFCELLHLTGTLILPRSNCKLCYQDMRCSVSCCFKQNHKRGSHGNPLGLCLSTACPLEAKSYFPTPLTPVSMEAFNIGNSSAWDLKRVLLALLWMEMNLSL